MKILILHQFFQTPYAGGAIRSFHLAKALVDKGHQVIVIAGHSGKKPETRQIDGIEVHYIPVDYDNKYGLVRRSWAFLSFAFNSIRLASSIPAITSVYAISVPLTIAIPARWISARRRIPYFFEVGDLWPDAPIQMGFLRNPVTTQFLFQLERKTYRKAKGVVAMSPSIADAVRQRAPQVPVWMIPNMADCQFFQPSAKDPALETKYGTNGKFVVSYIGAAGLANGLDYFIECVNLARKENLPIHFFLCGTGAVLERLKKHANHLMLQNITFTGFIDREEVRRILSISDAAFVSYKNVPILETGSPNKFFDGLAAGKLIIVNFSGWIRKEVEQAKCGIWVNPSDPTDFIRKIKVFISDPEWLRQHQQAARELAERKFSKQELVNQLIQVIES